MSAHVIAADRLGEWVATLLSSRRVAGPVRDADGVVHFRDLDEAGQLALDFDNSAEPPKALFFPKSETLFELRDLGDVPNVTTHVPPAHTWVLFGVRLCDAKGLMLLDLLFADREADPYYVRRRESGTVVALRCDEPTVECFCETAGSVLSVPEGADVVLTPLEGRFLVESFSPKGEALVAGAGALLAEAHAADLEAKGETVRQAAAAQRRQVNLEGIRDAIAARFDDQDLWRRFSRACVGCGICTFLCPTCSCFDVLDDAAGANGKRYRCWDSCQFDQFCLEASGHDPRPERWVRQRNRVAHKLYYSVDRFGRVTCVGCGRCIRQCPVNVDITEAVRAVAAPAPESTE